MQYCDKYYLLLNQKKWIFDFKIIIMKFTGLTDNFKFVSPNEDFVIFLNNNL